MQTRQVPAPAPAPADLAALANQWKRSSHHNYWLHSDLETLLKKPNALLNVPDEPITFGNDVASRFGRKLRELRRERNLTQTDMAKRFGIDRSYISDVEHGKKSISLSMLEVLSLGFEVSLAELLKDI